MVSTGTVGKPVVDFKLRPERGRESVLVAGRMRIRPSATIESYDLELRTIKSFNATVFARAKGAAAGGTMWGPPQILGSITGPAGALGNTVVLRCVTGSIYGATFHLGTATGGTVSLSYFAVGG